MRKVHVFIDEEWEAKLIPTITDDETDIEVPVDVVRRWKAVLKMMEDVQYEIEKYFEKQLEVK